MTLSPDEIASKTFPLRRKGYDQEEVDAFLTEIAEALLEGDAPGALEGAGGFEQMGREVAAVLKTAQDSATELRRKAQEEADRIRQQATDKAHQVQAAAEKTSAEERVAAKKQAQDLVRNAATQAQETVQAAAAEARELTDSTRQRCSEMLDDAVRRHQRLQQYERELRDRITAVEGTVATLRTEIESAASEVGIAGTGAPEREVPAPPIWTDQESREPKPKPLEEERAPSS